MTVIPSKTTQELVWIMEVEPARRLEDAAWIPAGPPNTECYYVAHPEGKPSWVQECLKSTGVILSYMERGSIALCQANPSSWYWDVANERLYVQTSTGADPSGGFFLVDSFFWDRIADRTIVLDGHQYRPLLDPDGLPALSFEAPPFSVGGISQTYGEVKALNDSWWDERLYKYVYEGKRIVMKYGVDGDVYALYKTYFDGYTGAWIWEDDKVIFKTEDPRKLQE